MCAILKPLLNNLWRNIMVGKCYVKIDGEWVRVYPESDAYEWAAYTVALLLLCATVGIVLW